MPSWDHIGARCVTNGLRQREVWSTTSRQNTVKGTHIHVLYVTNGSPPKSSWRDIQTLTDELRVEKSRSYVRCVTNGLHIRQIWASTFKRTTEKDRIRAHSARNVSRRWATWGHIWTFTPGSTCVPTAERIVETTANWRYTGEVILERDRLCVLSVTNDSAPVEVWLLTADFTAETSRTNASSATRLVRRIQVWRATCPSTPGTNRTRVRCATEVLVTRAACSHTNAVCTAMTENICVRIAECSLRQTVISGGIRFVYTQSDTNLQVAVA